MIIANQSQYCYTGRYRSSVPEMSLQTDPLLAALIVEKPGLLRRSTRILGSVSAAEDVLQRLWLKLQQTENRAVVQNPRAYLYRLVTNLAIDQRRADDTRERIQAKADAYLWGPSQAVSAEQTLISKDMLERVMMAIETLGEPTRTMFKLNRFEDMRIADIAALYAVSTTTVENHLRRALGRLREVRDGA